MGTKRERSGKPKKNKRPELTLDTKALREAKGRIIPILASRHEKMDARPKRKRGDPAFIWHDVPNLDLKHGGKREEVNRWTDIPSSNSNGSFVADTLEGHSGGSYNVPTYGSMVLPFHFAKEWTDYFTPRSAGSGWSSVASDITFERDHDKQHEKNEIMRDIIRER